MLRLSSLGVLMGSLYGKLTSSDSMVHHYVDNTECDNLQSSFNTTEPDQKVRICYMKISILIIHSAGYKNISVLHLSCRMSVLQFSLVLQTHALVL